VGPSGHLRCSSSSLAAVSSLNGDGMCDLVQGGTYSVLLASHKAPLFDARSLMISKGLPLYLPYLRTGSACQAMEYRPTLFR
jgi:hypothetical protein